MLNDYINWIEGKALPTWAERGFDAQSGRFCERLDTGGTSMRTPHRSMVQARQIVVFAQAAEQGWTDGAEPLAEIAMASLLRDFAQTNGGETSFAFSIDPSSGSILSHVRDTYAHAFVLFSIAALYRLNGDKKLLNVAEQTINFIERHLMDPAQGGLLDGLPTSGGKRQNPHMHLLEAYLFLERAAPQSGYLERAALLVDLFQRYFFRDGVLLEHFRHDWSVAERAVWEPGHHFEWVWLLGQYAALTGKDLTTEMDKLHNLAVRHGMTEDGSLVDELSPQLAILKASRRLWPHTEAIKAAATRHNGGDANARAFADQMAEVLMGRFLDRPFSGGWIDHIGASGEPLVNYVPASSLYHLFLAAAEARRAFMTETRRHQQFDIA